MLLEMLKRSNKYIPFLSNSDVVIGDHVVSGQLINAYQLKDAHQSFDEMNAEISFPGLH